MYYDGDDLILLNLEQMLKTNPLPQDGTTNLETFELATISSASVIIIRRSAQTPRRSINPGNPLIINT